MSKEKRKSVFNIAVVGLSGTEQIKGESGVGKSCLCNRFVREEADNYYPDHTSVLSQSDFGGRVVNNDHFLFWGDVTKKDDSGIDYKFNVIEQTEFIDDQSYQPHRSSSNQLYVKRCAQTKISSAEKMMYICTDQLAIESDFDVKLMPEGKVVIDGFILCFDVSFVKYRTIDDQVRFVQNVYHYLAKTKKPILFALTKCDEALNPFVAEAMKFAASCGGKRSSGIPVVETSASENINVTQAFLNLAQLIDKSRSKSKIASFEDAAQVRKELLKDAKKKLETLLAHTVVKYDESWTTARKTLENELDYQRFVDLEGKNAASKIFRKHVNRLRDEYRSELQSKYLHYLPRALKLILPNVVSLRPTWNDTLLLMSKNPKFDSWIVSLDSINSDTGGRPVVPWYEHKHINSLEDRRIPYELLLTLEAEQIFRFHRQELEVVQRRCEVKDKFREMLAHSPQVTPGREWDEVAKFFKQNNFFNEISENELSTIYEQFQTEITEKAKENFQELLWEKLDIFASNNNGTHMDIQGIASCHDALKEDPRYIAMAKLPKQRDEILNRHISETLYPPVDTWGSECLGKVLQVKRDLKSGKHQNSFIPSPSLRWQLKEGSDSLNVVLLGADGLSHELANEITVHSSDDEYTLDGCIHQLRLRSIDGNVRLLSNSFKTSSFSPHGCIAVYSSMESLRYIEKSLENTVMSLPDQAEAPPFQGLPVSILLASYSNSEKEVHKLRDAGERLASRIGCPFIDVLPPEYAYNRRFHESQIRLAMRSLIEGIKERAGSGRNSTVDPDQSGGVGVDGTLSPDLRIIMCTRKGDLSAAEIALFPLLNHTSFRDCPPKDTEEEDDDAELPDSVVIETYLGNRRRRIAVTLTSYQSARHLLSKGHPLHGFILVYDTMRKSSFSILKVFANNTASAYPLLLLCVSPNEERPPAAAFFQQNKIARQLVVDGNTLADKLQAKFVSASSKHRHQPQVYSTFFKDAWEHKEDTEAIHRISRVVVESNDDVKEDEREENGTGSSTPRSSASERKSFGGEYKTSYEVPYVDSDIAPPNSLHFNVSSQSTYTESPSTCDADRATPSSTWSIGSDDYRPETPRASPTAGLIDNEMNPAYDNCEPYTKKTSQPSHLYPNNSTNAPGKLNPDLLNRVAAGIKKQPVRQALLLRQQSLSDTLAPEPSHEPPYMTVHDPTKVGFRVLPPGYEQGKQNESKADESSEKSNHLPRSSAITSSISHKWQPKSMKRSLKTSDIESPTATTPPTIRSSRHSTADVLSQSYNAPKNDDTVSLGRGFTSSQEDLLHPSPSVLSSSSVVKGLLERSSHTPKDEKLWRKEEKRRKEEEKKKEKEQRIRYKEKQKQNQSTRHPPNSVAIGNKHNVSDYFNKNLDEIIQGLNHMVPLFVEKCVQFLETYGLSTEGLYRIPANAKERENLIRRFDEDNTIEFNATEVSVSTITGSLTWFFSQRNLPDPLIPYHLHDELEEAVGMPDASLKVCSVRGVIRKLPYANYATFKYLCTHLRTVSDNEAENKMSSENLAICWWPTLFRPEVDLSLNSAAVAGMTKICFRDVLLACINQYAFIFYGKQEV
uniref:rho GTPase-activating protein 35 isoform X1 n=1 Tax=Ciona intestinalis TaxID=7719 RepID=UPI00089DC48E|nr:rho GTPase-activating protein 35 isoform X1 [Ciona intestinalis]XP_026693614.1 rho GTPase-activating protein 35 isoform X2 [Ciona intestinalis]|eukprot:XP_018670541.1 rho GTPase-activating protein 35 isoform X1 [Ciona intestinalis]